MARFPQTARYTRVSLGANGDSGRRNVCNISFVRTDLHAPQAASATALASSLTLTTSGVTDQPFSPAVQPDVPRNITVTLGGTTANIGAGNIVVTGTSAQGAVITDTIVVTSATGGLLSGVKAFATVTDISYPATTGSGVTSTVGYGLALGIGLCNLSTGVVRVYAKTVAGTPASNETLIAPTSSVLHATLAENNTVTVNGTLNGTINYFVYVLNYNWAINPVLTKTVNVFGLK